MIDVLLGAIGIVAGAAVSVFFVVVSTQLLWEFFGDG
jgi:hypothetical protein